MKKIKREDCSGCYDDFYNGATKKCFSFAGATFSKGRPQHKDTLPKHYTGSYKLVPDCYIYQQGFIQRESQDAKS